MQKLGGRQLLVPMRNHALDPQYAQKLGVKGGRSADLAADNGEQALEITDMLVRSASVDVGGNRLVRSVTPKAEDRRRIYLKWGCMRPDAQALRKLTANIKRSTHC